MSMKDGNFHKNIIQLNFVNFVSDFFDLIEVLMDKECAVHRKEAEIYEF